MKPMSAASGAMTPVRFARRRFRLDSIRHASRRRIAATLACRLHLDLGLALQQRLGLGHEFFAQLVGAPALPAFQLTGGAERGMHTGLNGRVQVTGVVLECIAQCGGGAPALALP
jgi:hypothetical protein